jgi:hypothetical protein
MGKIPDLFYPGIMERRDEGELVNRSEVEPFLVQRSI